MFQSNFLTNFLILRDLFRIVWRIKIDEIQMLPIHSLAKQMDTEYFNNLQIIRKIP